MKLKPEEQLQAAIVRLWRLCGRRDVQMICVPNHALRTSTQRIVGAQMGVWPGCPDLMFLPPAGEPAAGMELKIGRKRASPDQRVAIERLIELGHRIRVVRSVDQARATFLEWGLLRR